MNSPSTDRRCTRVALAVDTAQMAAERIEQLATIIDETQKVHRST